MEYFLNIPPFHSLNSDRNLSPSLVDYPAPNLEVGIPVDFFTKELEVSQFPVCFFVVIPSCPQLIFVRLQAIPGPQTRTEIRQDPIDGLPRIVRDATPKEKLDRSHCLARKRFTRSTNGRRTNPPSKSNAYLYQWTSDFQRRRSTGEKRGKIYWNLLQMPDWTQEW